MLPEDRASGPRLVTMTDTRETTSWLPNNGNMQFNFGKTDMQPELLNRDTAYLLYGRSAMYGMLWNVIVANVTIASFTVMICNHNV